MCPHTFGYTEYLGGLLGQSAAEIFQAWSGIWLMQKLQQKTKKLNSACSKAKARDKWLSP